VSYLQRQSQKVDLEYFVSTQGHGLVRHRLRPQGTKRRQQERKKRQIFSFGLFKQRNQERKQKERERFFEQLCRLHFGLTVEGDLIQDLSRGASGRRIYFQGNCAAAGLDLKFVFRYSWRVK
jgi:predicted RNA-binding protein